jgi:hypothetical protein
VGKPTKALNYICHKTSPLHDSQTDTLGISFFMPSVNLFLKIDLIDKGMDLLIGYSKYKFSGQI